MQLFDRLIEARAGSTIKNAPAKSYEHSVYQGHVSLCSSDIITVHCHICYIALYGEADYFVWHVCGVLSRSKVEIMQLQQQLQSRSEPLSADAC